MFCRRPSPKYEYGEVRSRRYTPSFQRRDSISWPYQPGMMVPSTMSWAPFFIPKLCPIPAGLYPHLSVHPLSTGVIISPPTGHHGLSRMASTPAWISPPPPHLTAQKIRSHGCLAAAARTLKPGLVLRARRALRGVPRIAAAQGGNCRFQTSQPNSRYRSTPSPRVSHSRNNTRTPCRPSSYFSDSEGMDPSSPIHYQTSIPSAVVYCVPRLPTGSARTVHASCDCALPSFSPEPVACQRWRREVCVRVGRYRFPIPEERVDAISMLALKSLPLAAHSMHDEASFAPVPCLL